MVITWLWRRVLLRWVEDLRADRKIRRTRFVRAKVRTAASGCGGDGKSERLFGYLTMASTLLAEFFEYVSNSARDGYEWVECTRGVIHVREGGIDGGDCGSDKWCFEICSKYENKKKVFLFVLLFLPLSQSRENRKEINSKSEISVFDFFTLKFPRGERERRYPSPWTDVWEVKIEAFTTRWVD